MCNVIETTVSRFYDFSADMKSRISANLTGTRPRKLRERERGIRMNLADLAASEWCFDFEQKMRFRLIMGAYRYGRLGSGEKPIFNYAESAIAHIREFLKTGNKEHLVDAANLAMLEYVDGQRHHAFFESLDDANHHTKQVN